MKRLIFLRGTMGVGKSAVSHELKKMLAPCAFLDGDWCWDLEPFTVTEETKALVLGNAAYLLDSFLRCSAVENVLFCWVMPARSVIDDLLSRNYALARRVITVMGSRLRYLGDSLSAQTCDVRHRVGRLLLSLAHESLRDPAAWEQPLALPVSLSQGQMAAMVCSTQPTVSETLHQLQDEGLIDIRGRGIVIRRPQALLAALESPADRA